MTAAKPTKTRGVAWHAARLALPPALLLLGALLWTIQPVWPGSAPAGPPEVDAGRLRLDVEFLAGTLALRNHAHPETLGRAAGYIERRFHEAGAAVEVAPYEVDGATVRNVIARFGPPGDHPVVIGAHYDADERTPGADDNASGIAGLLALADHFRTAPPRVPVELVAYCFEEDPYFGTENMGSRRHARSLRLAGREPQLVMVLEMIGYFTDRPGSQRYPVDAMEWIYPERGDFVAVVGNYASAGEVRLVKAGMLEAGSVPVEAIAAPASLPGVDQSDHASYWHEGMPAVMITDTAYYRNPNYHGAGDLPGTLDYRRMAGVVRAVRQVVKHIEDQQPS